jgi:hypothetical protein
MSSRDSLGSWRYKYLQYAQYVWKTTDIHFWRNLFNKLIHWDISNANLHRFFTMNTVTGHEGRRIVRHRGSHNELRDDCEAVSFTHHLPSTSRRILVLISVGGWVHTKTTVWMEGGSRSKNANMMAHRPIMLSHDLRLKSRAQTQLDSGKTSADFQQTIQQHLRTLHDAIKIS